MATGNPSNISRDSRFELLRIFAMMMIVSYHLFPVAISHLDCTSVDSCFLRLFGSWGILGVDLFVLISCYFSFSKGDTVLDSKRFSSVWNKKVKGIVLQTAFYLLSYFILLSFSTSPLNSLYRFSVGILSNQLYWFVPAYIVLQFCIPLIKGIPASKNMFILSNILLLVSNICSGYDIIDDACQLLFIAMFFLQALKLPQLSRFFHKYALLGFISLTGFMVSSFFLQDFLITGAAVGNSRLATLSNVVNGSILPRLSIFDRYSYLMAVDSVFLFFVVLRIKPFSNRIINYLASLMLGVYLFHENPYSPVKLLSISLFKSAFNSGILVFVVSVLAIMIVGMIVEQIRKWLFAAVNHCK